MLDLLWSFCMSVDYVDVLPSQHNLLLLSTTNATLLSAVKIILLSSCFSSLMALNSSLVIFDLVSFTFFRRFFISTLSSSASPSLSFWHTCSMEATYSSFGRFLGMIAKFGPWASSLVWASVNGVSNKFLTHLESVSVVWALLPWSSLFEWPPVFRWHNTSNFLFCQTITLWCLHSITLLMKSWHSSSKLLWSCSNFSFNCWAIQSLSYVYSSSELFMDLTHSFKSFLSVFLIIARPLTVLIFVLSLILTGMTSIFKHLSENLLWLWSLPFFSQSSPTVTKGKHFLPQTPHSNVNVDFSFCLVLIVGLNYVLNLRKQNKFLSKHKLLPVNLTWLFQVYIYIYIKYWQIPSASCVGWGSE